ncbi:Uncharacterized protein TCM_037702 [Theobroma cacao]|uniref:Uncharacterized protein n=1 Tax=Theobroma cacao TaxID=3641 RepID=A0A061GLV5_THECC|nr:Uncharacterized protein TCM_037702 [Theobroma cacao]
MCLLCKTDIQPGVHACIYRLEFQHNICQICHIYGAVCVRYGLEFVIVKWPSRQVAFCGLFLVISYLVYCCATNLQILKEQRQCCVVLSLYPCLSCPFLISTC